MKLIRWIVALIKWVAGLSTKQKLAAPTNLQVVALSGTDLSYTWDETEGAVRYQIQVSEDATFQTDPGVPQDPTEEEFLLTVEDASFLLENLSPGEERYARVRALAEGKLNSDWSLVVNATTLVSELWLEAECGAIGNTWDIVVDGTAENGKHITIPPGTSSTDNPPTGLEDKCTYVFTTDAPGNYKIWFRVIVQNAGTDSIWVRVNSGAWIRFNNIDIGTSWHWDVLQDTDAGQQEVVLGLGVGEQTLEVAYREPVIQIDRIYITKDGDTPSGAGGTAINCVVPDDPTELVLNSTQFDVINVSWTNNANNANGYTLEWSPNGTDTWTQLQDSKGNSFSHTGLTANTAYYYRVRGYNTTGNSNYLTGNRTTLQNPQLETPIVGFSAISLTQLRANWQDVPNAQDYTVEYDDDGTFTSPTVVTPSVSGYTIGGLSPGETKFIRVKAMAPSFIDSDWSVTKSATTPGAGQQLATPTGLVANAVSSSQIDFSWSIVPDGAVYVTQLDTDPGFPSPTQQTVNSPTLTDSFTGLTENTTYYLRVKAQNTGGGFTDSEWAPTNVTTPPSSPASPTIYYVSPTGNNTNISTNSRTNPASARFFADGVGYSQLQPGDRVYYRTDQGPYTLSGGFRIYATGTLSDPIIYQAEPGGGFAHFRISRFPQSNWNHLDRYVNPNSISIGGEWEWKNPNDTSDPIAGWRTIEPENSSLGNYCWIIGFCIEGQFKSVTGGEKARDFSTRTDKPYGSTGARAAGTITGEIDGAYDYFSGNIGINARGARVISSIIYHNGQAGSLGASSAILSTDVYYHLNVIVGTGHSGNVGRDHGHNRYNQHRSDAQGYFIIDGDTLIGSCEEQLQAWSQGGVVNQGQPDEYSKVDKFRIIDCVALHGGGMSGASYPGRDRRNLLFGGYTWDQDSRIIGFLSYKNPGDNDVGMQFGFSLNGNNDRRNLWIENCYSFNDSLGINLMNVKDVQKFENNTIVVREPQDLINWQITTGQQSTWEGSLTNLSNNKYYAAGPSGVYRLRRQLFDWNGSQFVIQSDNSYSIASWQSAFPGSEVGSSIISGVPTNFEKVKNNNFLEYSPPIIRKKTIFNHELQTANSVTISDSDGLTLGNKVRIIDLQNMAANGIDNFIVEHTFTGGTNTINFTVPDENSGVAQDPTGEMTDYKHSTIEMCHVAVVRVR